MTTNDFILVSKIEGIATVTLNRPEKRNALNDQVVLQLSQVLRELAQDEKVKVVLLQGSGEHFCAGADINWMQKIATATDDENYEDAQRLSDLIYSWYMFPKPTIVLAHGATVGGGLGLVAAADIAVAAKNASFGFSEVKIGIAPSIVSPYVVAAIGERMAHYYFLTGERFGAEVAHRIHLVQELAEVDALPSVGVTLAQTLLKNSSHAMRAAKQLIRYVAKEKITDVLAQKTAEHLAHMRKTSDAQEGLKAFLEKRTPIFHEKEV